MESLVSNVVLNIRTNCKIDQRKFVLHYGGVFSSVLPAARRIVYINQLRYSFLVHSTGNIILSNFHFSYNLSDLFSWVCSLLHDMIRKQIARVNGKLKINFLVENICCATNVDMCQRSSTLKIIQSSQLSMDKSSSIY